MNENTLLYEFKKLPEGLQKDALHYIILLREEFEKKANPNPNKRVYGISKDKYQLSNDFDEPLEEFNEYMR